MSPSAKPAFRAGESQIPYRWRATSTQRQSDVGDQSHRPNDCRPGHSLIRFKRQNRYPSSAILSITWDPITVAEVVVTMADVYRTIPNTYREPCHGWSWIDVYGLQSNSSSACEARRQSASILSRDEHHGSTVEVCLDCTDVVTLQLLKSSHQGSTARDCGDVAP